MLKADNRVCEVCGTSHSNAHCGTDAPVQYRGFQLQAFPQAFENPPLWTVHRDDFYCGSFESFSDARQAINELLDRHTAPKTLAERLRK